MDTQLAIKEKLEQAHTIAIFWHQHIDGDALGAMYGLGLQLEKQGKQISYFTPDEPGRIFDFLDLSKLQTEFDYGKYDVLVFVDFTEYKRIGAFTSDFKSYFDEQQKIILDHHLYGEDLPNASVWRDETAMSTCELVYELTVQRRGEKKLIDPKVATFLYMGMLTDSGNLLYDVGKQTERLMGDMLDMVKLGAEKKLIIDNVLRRKSYEDVQFMQFLLGRMQKEGDFLYSRYTQAEKAEFGVDSDSSDNALHILCDIEGFDLVILGKESTDGKEIKISLRGRGKYDCNQIANLFGGGGHFNAAGCEFPFSWDMGEDMKKFIAEVRKVIIS